ncbi:hypothetical protein CA850_09750 [Micromonospora echinospora]|uniref:Uncharacterized protein n=1 Tax=Micromonospora echinospora TaxID=1877 RepID=A0A1C4XMG5_MICEC|nr:hypothetical protein [Micromonospora echinospora]OZV82536.1 hypothetical protein CA850_09750 [Micromonospora echinospora]SCF09667.1 hypothetical protein GA0070618_3187 [Micromonospora echinospora]
MDTDLDVAPEVTRDDERDGERDESMHALLLRLAGSLPDRVLTDARDALAAGRRLDVVQAVAFEAVSQPLQLDADEIAALREELALSDGDLDLGMALEELRGERPPAPWQFLSDLPTTQEELASMVLPQDRTADPVDLLDPIDQALLEAASAIPTVRAVWRAWRMPSAARPWQDPLRVAVVSVDDTMDSLPAASARLRQAMVEAGDADAQVEVCWAGVDAPFYQTLARASGSLLWAARPATPVTTARLFDGVDPERGPWFATNRPVVSDATERDELLAALRGGVVIAWSSAAMPDILAPDRGDVVPMHLRTDGTWLWSEAVGYYLENYGLAPDPQLVTHLTGDGPIEPLDEISVHRALVHLCRPDAEAVVWQAPGPDDDPVAPADAASSDVPSPDGVPARPELPDVTPEARPDAGTHRPVLT